MDDGIGNSTIKKGETFHQNETRYAVLPRHGAALILVLGASGFISSTYHNQMRFLQNVTTITSKPIFYYTISKSKLIVSPIK